MTEPRACEQCGAAVYPGVNFCTTCGAYQGWATHADEVASPPDQAPRQPVGVTRPVGVQGRPTASAPFTIDPSPAQRPPATDDAPPGRRAGERACVECGTRNRTELRFCRRCGHLFGDPQRIGAAFVAASAKRAPWWRRLLRIDDPDRRARRTYRRSLPVWMRVRRYVAAVAALALVFVYFRVVGRDPVGWVQRIVDSVRGTLVGVPSVSVAADPADAVVPHFPPRAAIDGRSDTAWSTVLASGKYPAGPPCATVGQQAALLLSIPAETTVRAIDIRAGLDVPAAQRVTYWRPKLLDISFADGSCQRVTLHDTPAWQKVDLAPVKTNAVRVTVVAGFPSQKLSRGPQFVYISELRLLERPPH